MHGMPWKPVNSLFCVRSDLTIAWPSLFQHDCMGMVPISSALLWIDVRNQDLEYSEEIA